MHCGEGMVYYDGVYMDNNNTWRVYPQETPKMIKQIKTGQQIFSRKAKQATEADKQVVTDMLDTLRANRERCVGMAANMIGVSKRIIAFDDHGKYAVLFNPEIVKKSDPYTAEEGCLSLNGVRQCTRYKEIEVDYLDSNFKPQHSAYSGYVAQIIQHEIDHCNGIII